MKIQIIVSTEDIKAENCPHCLHGNVTLVPMGTLARKVFILTNLSDAFCVGLAVRESLNNSFGHQLIISFHNLFKIQNTLCSQK